MAQTVGIRLNMLALSQASSLSKSIKHDFTTPTEHVCVCLLVYERGGEVMRLTGQRGKYLHENGERLGEKRSPAPKCSCSLLPLLKASFSAVQGNTPLLTATHKHNVLTYSV